MNECMALVRLIYQHNRFALTIVGSILLSGLASAWMISLIYPDLAMVILIWSFVPISVWVFAAMELDTSVDMLNGESFYNHWLLRQPLANWQLAIVPNVLRCLIIGCLWMLLATITSIASGQHIPVAIPAMAFSALAIWIAAIAWRPARYGFLRLVWIPIFLLGLWATAMITAMEVEARISFPYRYLAMASAPIMLAGGFCMSYRSILRARSSPLGLIPQSETHVNRWKTALYWLSWFSRSPNAPYQHRRAPLALAWHDVSAASPRITMMWLMSMSIALGLALWSTMPARAVIATTALLAFFASMTSQNLIETGSAGGRTLASYLIASPMRSATIAWTRTLTVLAVFLVMMVSFAIPLGLSMLRPVVRNAVAQWVTQMNMMYDSQWAATRIVAASLILFLLLLAGRSISTLWATYWGNARLFMYVGVVGPLWVMTPMFIVPLWFLRQADWESAIANAWWWAGFLPSIGAGLMLAKTIAVAAALRALWQSGLEEHAVIAKIGVSWVVCWLLVSSLVFCLIPDTRVAWWWIVILVGLISPLARILVMPLALRHDRHR